MFIHPVSVEIMNVITKNQSLMEMEPEEEILYTPNEAPKGVIRQQGEWGKIRREQGE